MRKALPTRLKRKNGSTTDRMNMISITERKSNECAEYMVNDYWILTDPDQPMAVCRAHDGAVMWSEQNQPVWAPDYVCVCMRPGR